MLTNSNQNEIINDNESITKDIINILSIPFNPPGFLVVVLLFFIDNLFKCSGLKFFFSRTNHVGKKLKKYFLKKFHVNKKIKKM